MEDNEFAHYGVMGMHWGQTKSGSGETNRKVVQKQAIELVNQLIGERKGRSRSTKINDYFFSDGSSNRLLSEYKPKTGTAKRSSEIYNQLEKIRKQRILSLFPKGSVTNLAPLRNPSPGCVG